VEAICYVLSLLRIHKQDCKRCAPPTSWHELQKRLEDVRSWETRMTPEEGEAACRLSERSSRISESSSIPFANSFLARELRVQSMRTKI
jgi:hypothetical protein